MVSNSDHSQNLKAATMNELSSEFLLYDSCEMNDIQVNKHDYQINDQTTVFSESDWFW